MNEQIVYSDESNRVGKIHIVKPKRESLFTGGEYMCGIPLDSRDKYTEEDATCKNCLRVMKKRNKK